MSSITQREVLAMTPDQFRLFMISRLNSDQRERKELRDALAENTTLTRNSNEKLASVFAIMNFTDKSAKRIVKLGRFLSAAAKIILPIVALYGAGMAIYNGHFPSLKDLL